MIASAALIMISVFFGFVLGTDPIVKMMGVGLAVAVFLDATIVRLVLVPATMKLMGHANWWLPKWLDRILPNLDIEGDSGLPAPVYRDDQELDERIVTMPAAYSIEPWTPPVRDEPLPVELAPAAAVTTSLDPFELADLVARVEEAFAGLGLDFEDSAEDGYEAIDAVGDRG